jgi:hypothetical protein
VIIFIKIRDITSEILYYGIICREYITELLGLIVCDIFISYDSTPVTTFRINTHIVVIYVGLCVKQ